MIKKIFSKNRRSISELILEATRELGKCYSRIELMCSKLAKRDRELFEACVFHIKNGSKARASIYANEIAEIRRILSVFEYARLAVERTILRLDTLKVISPTLEPLQETFMEVKDAIGLVANVMPSMTFEINKLNSVVNEILKDTEFNLSMPEVTVTGHPDAEAILREAASLVEEELKTKLPEPPLKEEKTEASSLIKADRPLVALSVADRGEYKEEGFSENDSEKAAERPFDVSLFLTEELVMDYIERNGGEMNVARCSKELNMPRDQVMRALESLKKKGKIKIQQWQ